MNNTLHAELETVELELSSMPCDNNGNPVDRVRAAELIKIEEELIDVLYHGA